MSTDKNDQKSDRSGGKSGDDTLQSGEAEQSVGDALIEKLLFHTVLPMVPDRDELPGTAEPTAASQDDGRSQHVTSSYIERWQRREGSTISAPTSRDTAPEV